MQQVAGAEPGVLVAQVARQVCGGGLDGPDVADAGPEQSRRGIVRGHSSDGPLASARGRVTDLPELPEILDRFEAAFPLGSLEPLAGQAAQPGAEREPLGNVSGRGTSRPPPWRRSPGHAPRPCRGPGFRTCCTASTNWNRRSAADSS